MQQVLQTINTHSKSSGCIVSLIGGRSENQDSAGYVDTPLGLLVVVCDGMGGMKGGKHASSLAVKTVIDDMNSSSAEDNAYDVVKNAVYHANSVVYEEGRKEEFKGMGTTIVALLVSDNSAIAAQVGDSRIYQLRGGKKIFRTTDHSMVFDMVKANVITEEQARLSSCSNVILKALGIAESVEPDVYELTYRKGDRFVLCTDGFWAAAEENLIIKKLSAHKAPDKLLASMSAEINEIGIQEGGNHDNLTAAIIDVHASSLIKDRFMVRDFVPQMFFFLVLIVSIGFNIYACTRIHNMMSVRSDLEELKQELIEVQENLTAFKLEKIIDKISGRSKDNTTISDNDALDNIIKQKLNNE